MERGIRSLRGIQKMPLPEWPKVVSYGKVEVGVAHDLHLFPAIIRPKSVVKAEQVMEDGAASCFFHPKLSATAVCNESGRMICDLCSTEWEGETVSFEALQSLLVRKSGKVQKRKGQLKWDDIALALAVYPILFFPLIIVTAPAALIICALKWKAGPTSPVRKTRVRYVIAALLACVQLTFVGLFFLGMLS